MWLLTTVAEVVQPKCTFKDKGDDQYNAWEEDIAVVNIFFGEETVMGGNILQFSTKLV